MYQEPLSGTLRKSAVKFIVDCHENIDVSLRW